MGENFLVKDRKIDIILCIDGTGSMVPCIKNVKRNAKKFCKDFVEKMTTDYNSNVDVVNVKVITFRDYKTDGDKSMEISEWFELTGSDTELFDDYINGINVFGGDDLPENGLEALFFAMTADWRSIGDNDRQLIVLFTDADALPLGERKGCPCYPENMVDMKGFISTWMCKRPEFISQSDFNLRERNKRLIMFAPAGSLYEEISSRCNRSQFKPVMMDAGLEDIDFEDIIKVMAATASAGT